MPKSSPKPKRRVVKYMHTLNGRPANYNSKFRSLFFLGGQPVRLVASLQTIRRQARLSAARDKEIGAGDYRYGYVRVVVSDE